MANGTPKAWCASGILAITLLLAGDMPASANRLCRVANCLLAHDINGIALGMTISDVEAKFDGKLVHVAGDRFSASKDGVNYTLGFSSLERLYWIGSSQELGIFEPNSDIARSLTDRLVSKYGRPDFNQLPGGPISWDYAEYVVEGDARYSQFTEQLSAMFAEHYKGPTTLEMTLSDKRIERNDQARRNNGPAASASAEIRF